MAALSEVHALKQSNLQSHRMSHISRVNIGAVHQFGNFYETAVLTHGKGEIYRMIDRQCVTAVSYSSPFNRLLA